MPPYGRSMGAPAYVPHVRAHRLLRLESKPPCDRTPPSHGTPADPLGGAWRRLVVLLRRRRGARDPRAKRGARPAVRPRWPRCRQTSSPEPPDDLAGSSTARRGGRTVRSDRPHRVVIVGGGFGGLQAPRGLRSARVEITLVDRRNFHLFQPLTYQVATGALSPGEVAYPLRAIFKRDRNVRVLLAEVVRFDLEARQVLLEPVAGVPAPTSAPYDTLIVAGGSTYS